MFHELFELSRQATLAMTISADEKAGVMTINVIPKPKKDVGEPALTRPLSLTATPDEFEASFAQALRGYQTTRASLLEQAEATQEVLEAAKSASAKKATDATAKAAKTTGKAAQKHTEAANATEEDDEDSVA